MNNLDLSFSTLVINQRCVMGPSYLPYSETAALLLGNSFYSVSHKDCLDAINLSEFLEMSCDFR